MQLKNVTSDQSKHGYEKLTFGVCMHAVSCVLWSVHVHELAFGAKVGVVYLFEKICR